MLQVKRVICLKPDAYINLKDLDLKEQIYSPAQYEDAKCDSALPIIL